MNRHKLLITACGLAIVAGAYFIGQATAGGIPTNSSETLHYSGMLFDNGAPATGSQVIQVAFWDSAADGTSVCETASAATPVDGGHFRVTLPAACVAAVEASGDLWVEVLVAGSSLGRTGIGAVPYAIEAGHATTADSALVADSADSVEWANVLSAPDVAQLAAATHFRVSPSAKQTITTAQKKEWVELEWGTEGVADQAGAFDLATNAFKPSIPGLYRVTAQVYSQGWFQASKLSLQIVGGAPEFGAITTEVLPSAESGVTVTRLVRLDGTDGVTAQLWVEGISSDVSLEMNDGMAYFEGVRVGN